MDEIRKKNIKSIVAQRLVLFSALERGRARTDDGSPVISYQGDGFIYNTGLNSDIILDIQKSQGKKKLKSSNSNTVKELLQSQEDSLPEVSMAEAASSSMRSSDGGIYVTNSIRHLISLFENSSMQLTARNSMEGDTKTSQDSSANTKTSSDKEKCESKNVHATSDKSFNAPSDLSASSSLKNDLHSKEEKPLYDEPLSKQETQVGVENGSLETPQGILHAEDSVQRKTENIENAFQHPEVSDKPATVSQPQVPSVSRNGTESDRGIARQESNYENCPASLDRRTSEIKSVYVDPSFKVPTKEEDTPQTPPRNTSPKPATKKRTLGRGEIKPYEVVDLVSKEDRKDSIKKDENEKNEVKKEMEKPTNRMESMYVETFGKPLPNLDSDGYQTIPEYNEPSVDITREDSLDQNEFDLSNIGNDRHIAMDTEHVHQTYRKSEMKCHSLDSSLNSNYLSISSHSDYGWDSDEFDYETDDDLLDDNHQPKSKTCDADVTKKKILNIVNEILTTEKAYEKRLHLLDKVFQDRLMKEAKENSVLPEKVVQEIFSNLSSIYVFHSTMLRPDLEKRILNWSSNEKIGDIFKTLGHCLKLYTDYVKNFDHATTTLNQWMKKSPKFASVIEELQKLPECEHLSLQHHMLGPIQRIPRYKLLLTDYLKKLPEDSPDRAEAEESLVVISTAADHANNSMKGMDEFKKLVELEERISEGLHGESLATASRLFIKEGELVKIAARSDQKNLRVLLLFNDLLLCCNKIPATGKLKVKQMMDIPGMTIQDNEDIDLGEQFAFRIKSRQRVLDLAASNMDEKNDWMTAIAGVIQDYETKRGSLLKQYMEEDARKEAEKSNSMKIGESAPVWVKDEDVTMCMLCAVRFSFLSRRHHCRSCGRIVCDNCSKYKAQLAYINNNVKRVCYVCHRKLNVDKIQQTDSFMNKKTTIDRVARDPKRRRSTIVSEIKGDLLWKAPGKKWEKGWFAISDLVLFAHKGKKDPKAQLNIPLPGYSVCRPQASDEIDEGKHPYTFKVHFGNKKEMTYFFQADDETKMERWMDVITYSIKAEKPPPWSKTL